MKRTSDSSTPRLATLDQRVDQARLYILISGHANAVDFQALVTALVQAGVHVLQFRDKSLKDRELLERARILRQVTQPTETLFIMNDRPDLARLAEADGVHMGQDELSVHDARQIIGPERLIGVSTHSIQQARQAVVEGANYIGCGPTFPSKTKTFRSFPGTKFLEQVANEVRLPAFAIGGIDLGNVDAVLRTGFQRVAVSRAVLAADDPAAQARQFLQRLAE